MTKPRWLLFLFFFCEVGSGFPENVRHGYTNCAACHVSPTGGGLITRYGDRSSAEFLNTWKLEAEEESKGTQNGEEKKSLSPLLWGGNFRALTLYSNNGIVKQKALIPMQLEGEIAYTFAKTYTLSLAAGVYNSSVEAQRFYLLSKINDEFFVRAGRFMPAYGILSDNHTIITRKGVGFDQGSEPINLEVGFANEWGEVVLDWIIKKGLSGISANETGATVRGAWYAKGRSQLGISALATSSSIWNRAMVGAFVIAGFTPSVYWLSQLDQEVKTSVKTEDLSTPSSSRILTYNKLGWEFLQGAHAFVTAESSANTRGSFDPQIWAFGPGLQWFPVEHLELQAQWQQKRSSALPNQPGHLASLMMHYYF